VQKDDGEGAGWVPLTQPGAQNALAQEPGATYSPVMNDQAVVEAVRTGDESAFAAVVEPYRRQLHLHCYRMLGSVDEAEDLVQETLLRAWRGRSTFEGRALLRTWLYRIATNVCLNALERAPRRVMPQDIVPPVDDRTDASEARADPSYAPDIPWLQPYPNTLLEPSAPSAEEPEPRLVARETIELLFLAALQHLPPKQRAILILRDVVDWSAREVAQHLELSLASVNSAHQRARATMRALQPSRLSEAPSTVSRTDDERAALQTFMQAWEAADVHQMTALLRDDARWAMPPAPLWFQGRAAIERLYELFPIDFRGRRYRMLPSGANQQPAAAAYVREPGDSTYAFSALLVLRIEGGQIAEVTTFGPELCRAFGLAATL
jgi:RNA polymerase sigma-70 factor (ECF subfamily)